jgi:hypothetical protein
VSDRRLVYLSGEPGVGKSTLMREVTADWQRAYLPKEPGLAPARDLLADTRPPGTIRAVEIGRQRDQFSGTDALPSNCIDDATAYFATGQAAREAPLILAEGSRLAVRRFLVSAVDTGWRVQLLHLHGEELAAERRAARARWLRRPEQNPAWVKGRRTGCLNLATHAPDWGVEVLVVDAARLETDDTYRAAIIDTCRDDLRAASPPR